MYTLLMDNPSPKLIARARELGIETCVEFDTFLLKPEQRIRDLCRENKCGKFKNHYMCPPYTGSPEIHRGEAIRVPPRHPPAIRKAAGREE